MADQPGKEDSESGDKKQTEKRAALSRSRQLSANSKSRKEIEGSKQVKKSGSRRIECPPEGGYVRAPMPDYIKEERPKSEDSESDSDQ